MNEAPMKVRSFLLLDTSTLPLPRPRDCRSSAARLQAAPTCACVLVLHRSTEAFHDICIIIKTSIHLEQGSLTTSISADIIQAQRDWQK
jgi:hypothetical protein